jgi:hypothetical protein
VGKALNQSRERYVNVGISNDKRNTIRAPRLRSLSAYEDVLSRVHWEKVLFYGLVTLVKSEKSQEKQSSFKVLQYSVKHSLLNLLVLPCSVSSLVCLLIKDNNRRETSRAE